MECLLVAARRCLAGRLGRSGGGRAQIVGTEGEVAGAVGLLLKQFVVDVDALAGVESDLHEM